MRKALAVSSAVCLFFLLPVLSRAAPRPTASPFLHAQQDQQQQDQQYDQGDQASQEYIPYSPEQLDNLLAPIALYPDPLLAQVLPAATFTDQIDDAARYVRAYGDNGVDDQPWDTSVRSVAHYPEVLYMMDETLDWTTAVGQAYVNQSTDVMESIQRLRTLAYQQGNLVSNPQWQILDQDGSIQIWPASPEYIYVPTYDPGIVYYQRCYYGDRFTFGFAFSSGFPIGIWLNRDTDWRNHRVYYTGWRGNEGWVRRSRPYVQLHNTRGSNVYINNRAANVAVNRTVVNRVVNINNINNYNSVHRTASFNSTTRNRPTNNPQVNNRVINRNINTGDPRLDQFRGHQQAPMPGPPHPATQFPPAQNPSQPARPQVQPQPRPATPPRQSQPQPRQQLSPQPRYRSPAAVETGPHAFGRSETPFNPRAAQQRGAQSRQQPSQPAARPAPPPRPSPRPAPRAPSRPRAHGGAQ